MADEEDPELEDFCEEEDDDINIIPDKKKPNSRAKQAEAAKIAKRNKLLRSKKRYYHFMDLIVKGLVMSDSTETESSADEYHKRAMACSSQPSKRIKLTSQGGDHHEENDSNKEKNVDNNPANEQDNDNNFDNTQESDDDEDRYHQAWGGLTTQTKCYWLENEVVVVPSNHKLCARRHTKD